MSWDALLAGQKRLLLAVQSTGACTDLSLAAALTEIGARCDRSTLSRWRAGDRTAPLGLLRPMLVHLGDPQAVASVLRVLADGLGVDIQATARPRPTCPSESVAGLRMAMAETTIALERATMSSSPGGQKITRDEAATITEVLDELEAKLQEARVALESACL